MPPASPPKPERKKIQPAALAASAGGTVTAMFIGSRFGDSGTLIGAATGSVISGATSIVYENLTRDMVTLRTRLRRENPSPGHLERYASPAEKMRYGLHVNAVNRKQRRAIKWAGIITVSSFTAAVIVMVIVEGATGKTLHGVTAHTADYGSTLTGSTTTPPSAPAPSSPAPAPSAGSPVSVSPATIPATVTSAQPVPVSPSPSPAATPTPTTAPATPTVSPAAATTTPPPSSTPIPLDSPAPGS